MKNNLPNPPYECKDNNNNFSLGECVYWTGKSGTSGENVPCDDSNVNPLQCNVSKGSISGNNCNCQKWTPPPAPPGSCKAPSQKGFAPGKWVISLGVQVHPGLLQISGNSKTKGFHIKNLSNSTKENFENAVPDKNIAYSFKWDDTIGSYPPTVLTGINHIPWGTDTSQLEGNPDLHSLNTTCSGNVFEKDWDNGCNPESCRAIPALPSSVSWNWKKGSEGKIPFNGSRAAGLNTDFTGPAGIYVGKTSIKDGNDTVQWHYGRSTEFGSCCACMGWFTLPRCTRDYCADKSTLDAQGVSLTKDMGKSNDMVECQQMLGCSSPEVVTTAVINKSDMKIYGADDKNNITWGQLYTFMNIIFSDSGIKNSTDTALTNDPHTTFNGNFIAPAGYYYSQDIGLLFDTKNHGEIDLTNDFSADPTSYIPIRDPNIPVDGNSDLNNMAYKNNPYGKKTLGTTNLKTSLEGYIPIPFMPCGQCFHMSNCDKTYNCPTKSKNDAGLSGNGNIVARIFDSCTSTANPKWCEAPGYNGCGEMANSSDRYSADPICITTETNLKSVGSKLESENNDCNGFVVQACPLRDSRQVGRSPSGTNDTEIDYNGYQPCNDKNGSYNKLDKLKVNKSQPFANDTFHFDTGEPWTSSRLGINSVGMNRWRRVPCPTSKFLADDVINCGDTCTTTAKMAFNPLSNNPKRFFSGTETHTALTDGTDYYSPIVIVCTSTSIYSPMYQFFNIGGQGSVTYVLIKHALDPVPDKNGNYTYSGWFAMNRQNALGIDYPKSHDQDAQWSFADAKGFGGQKYGKPHYPWCIRFWVGDQWDPFAYQFQVDNFINSDTNSPPGSDFIGNYYAYNCPKAILELNSNNPFLSILTGNKSKEHFEDSGLKTVTCGTGDKTFYCGNQIIPQGYNSVGSICKNKGTVCNLTSLPPGPKSNKGHSNIIVPIIIIIIIIFAIIILFVFLYL